ncbi:MAG: hypothetical protein A2Y90_01145 [Chloroflexi bacterium RBG_13_52_12]|nr:MAG: hypothetical protein A2Y90_01145 [Chloroflexi bacterium RBG_13_52_12]
MRDSQKTRKQLLNELNEARRQLELLAAAEVESKQAGAELKQSEEKFYKAFLSSPDMIIITSISDGKYVEANESFASTTGYSRKELIGHTVDEFNMFANPAEQERMTRLIQERGSIRNEEFTFRVRSGEIRQWLCSAEIINIDGEPCMIAVAVDITELKKMEAALRESEEKFSKAFSSSPNAVCLVSVEESTFLEINESFTRFTGYSKEEIIGHTPYELELWVNQDDMKKMAKSLQETGSLINEEIRSKMKSGEIRTGLFSAQTIDIGGNKRMILVITDITDQVKAEEALANEAIWRRILMQNSKDGIVILDRNGKVFEANRRFTEILGYTPEEISQLHVWDWDTQWTRENLLGQIRDVNEAGDHFETYWQRKDGTVFNVEISTNGATFAGEKLVFCVCRDITERTQMEHALRESEEKFSKAFRASPEVITITSVSDGRYLEVNESFTRVFGYTREETIGRPSSELGVWLTPRDREKMMRKLQEHGRLRNEEISFITKSGEIRSVLFSAELIECEGELCVLSVTNDITDYKRIEAQALEAENLRAVDRLRTELLANVSHELRTPLASIKGFATMLLDYDKRLTQLEKREYLETIDKNADRLVELIEQLLEMSRLGAGILSIRKMPVNIIGLCQTIIAEARVRAPDHKYVLDLPRRLPQIDVDDRRIRQVLDNIIDNAVKYSSAGNEIILSIRKNGDKLLFTVTDHGIGIPAKELPHVFDRMFHSARGQKSGVPGAGLGLSICKGLVEAHGGEIWLESEEGAGTRCFFTLPLIAKPVSVIDIRS